MGSRTHGNKTSNCLQNDTKENEIKTIVYNVIESKSEKCGYISAGVTAVVARDAWHRPGTADSFMKVFMIVATTKRSDVWQF